VAPHSSILAWKIPWTEEPGRKEPGSFQGSDNLKVSNIEEGNGHPDPRSSKKEKKNKNKMNPKRYTLRYYSQKLKERTLKASRYKWLLYKRETPRILSTLFHGNGIG